MHILPLIAAAVILACLIVRYNGRCELCGKTTGGVLCSGCVTLPVVALPVAETGR